MVIRHGLDGLPEMKNSDQIEYWNGQAGSKWVQHAERLDELLEPFADDILGRADLKQGESILDVGCGAGALTLKVGFQVGDKVQSLGIDVSAPLLELARKRALERGALVRFEQADASIFQSGQKFDALLSRFGVMFFDEPVPAFANLNGLMRQNGRLTFACWQALSLNDWARAPLEAALPLLPSPPASPPPDAPGPFAFADKDRVFRILDDAGWNDIEIKSQLGLVRLPGETVSAAARFMMELGPVGRLLSAAGIEFTRVEAPLTETLSNHVFDDERVYMPAATWIVSARSAGA